MNSLSQTKLLKRNGVTKLHYADELQVMAERLCKRGQNYLKLKTSIFISVVRPFNDGGTALLYDLFGTGQVLCKFHDLVGMVHTTQQVCRKVL